MPFYRASLVWLLRCAALMIVALAGVRFYDASKAYDASQAYYEASWEAGTMRPLEMLPELIVGAGAAAALCLTFAEILSLLVRQTRT